MQIMERLGETNTYMDMRDEGPASLLSAPPLRRGPKFQNTEHPLMKPFTVSLFRAFLCVVISIVIGCGTGCLIMYVGTERTLNIVETDHVVSTGLGRFLSCALAGSTADDHQYTSPNPATGWFDNGYLNTWYMADRDYDGRDDYCRCVGKAPDTVVNCMKAGVTGFVNLYDFKIEGTEGCHLDTVNPFFGTS